LDSKILVLSTDSIRSKVAIVKVVQTQFKYFFFIYYI
jgi:hypothetical protein